MTSIDPTGTQQKEAAPVPVEHPRWCDLSLCTAPEFVPSAPEGDEPEKAAGAHRSANLADWGAHVVRSVFGGGREVFLQKDALSKPTSTWLMVGDSMILIDHDSPVLWALLDERDELWAKYPEAMAVGRVGAEQRVAKLRAKETRS